MCSLVQQYSQIYLGRQRSVSRLADLATCGIPFSSLNWTCEGLVTVCLELHSRRVSRCDSFFLQTIPFSFHCIVLIMLHLMI